MNEKLFDDFFGGVCANEFSCKDCPHTSEKEESFLSINIQVKNSKSIYQSLSNLTQKEILNGSNAYYCDICEKKVTATKRFTIKKMPKILILALKRFEFNYDNM